MRVTRALTSALFVFEAPSPPCFRAGEDLARIAWAFAKAGRGGTEQLFTALGTRCGLYQDGVDSEGLNLDIVSALVSAPAEKLGRTNGPRRSKEVVLVGYF